MGAAERCKFAMGVLCAVLALWMWGNRAAAAGFYENPYIVLSPDGQAWTVPEALPSPQGTDNRLNPQYWYPKGEVYLTGVESTLRQPEEGEHFYVYDRGGIIPISKWEVIFQTAKCIHPDYPYFHGKYYNGTACRSSYYSGWNAWCADCGERVTHILIYMSREKIRTLHEIDADLDYFYECPTCGHLEQGYAVKHKCQAVSANRYRVVYNANAGDASGYMQPSFHIYNNAEIFEGVSVTPATRLNQNGFHRTGYQFAGWNTDPLGKGDFYEDGQEIRNLTAENYEPESGKGTVVLYAQWKKVSGTLIVDPGEGLYKGKSGPASLSVRYEEKVRVSSDDITPPQGALVKFETFGGMPVKPVRGTREFLSWRLEQPARGSLQDETYQYLGEEGGQDRMTALYQEKGIRLPLPVKQGFSFGGWYRDPKCEIQVGKAGDLFVPAKDVTLYAGWVDLVLEAEVNLRDNFGRGAVDLQWFQPDGKSKVYLLYQKREGGEFVRIYDADDVEAAMECVEFPHTEKEETYRVLASGFYELKSYGAQGQAYGSYEGGRGGYAGGNFYLEKGDILTIRAGGQNGFDTGGEGQGYGNGGGRTEVISKELGTLLIAGGGGGASPGGNGGSGGLENGLWKEGAGKGQSGKGGGGGGYLGGTAGEYRVHVHEDTCLHRHLGNEKTGGECYALRNVERTCTVRISGPRRSERTKDCQNCLAAGRNGHNSVRLFCWAVIHENCGMETNYGSNGWWVCEVCGAIGFSYGSGSSMPEVSDHKYTQSVYVLDCERVYDCDEDTSSVLLPSCGGNSYVNTDAAVSQEREAGVWSGDGLVCVRPINVGFQEKMELIGAAAADLAAPEKISEDSVRKNADREGYIEISFSVPKDKGTLYYHQAKSYLPGTEQLISASNITCTEVVTGIAGYYYRIDDREQCILTAENANNRGEILEEPVLSVKIPDGPGYLHVAAVDRAGNVGESLSIRLSQDDPEVAWKLVTGQMEAGCQWEGTDRGSVAPAGERIYYVRADGRTPFLLSFAGEMKGVPRKDYQIDRACFCSELPGSGENGRYTLLFPGGELSETEEMKPEQWGRLAAGNDLLQASLYGRGARTERGARLEICQSFTLDSKYHGKSLNLTPVIGAAFGDGVVYSDWEEDKTHGITLIGDGEPPEIYGLELLDRQLLDREEGESLELDLWAEDTLSGVESFYATLYNLDNHGRLTCYPEEDGHIRISLSEDSPMFSGDLNLTVTAKDKVGNETVLEKGATEFGLHAEILRLLPPHTPEFKRGESGVLQVTVWGYADRLEIQFPEEFTAEDPALDSVIEYAVPAEKQEEKIFFMIPLYLSDNGEYSVTVRAFKGDRLLEQHPVLCTLRVEDTVLGELRTRLR